MARLKICPRCGLPYSYIERRSIGNRTYLYAVHSSYDGGRRVSKCYLGPQDRYAYVERIHQLDSLTNARDQDYLLTALSSIEKEVDRIEKILEIGTRAGTVDTNERLSIVNTIEERLEILRKLLKRLSESTP